jgi:predicted RND superfamily exporter protein
VGVVSGRQSTVIELPVFIAGALVVLASGVAMAFARPGWVVAAPRSVLAAIGLLSLCALAVLVRLDPPGFTIGVDPASEPLIRRNEPGLPGYAQATDDFGSDDVYVVAMETEDTFTHANLTALRELHHAMRRLPGVASVESLAHALDVTWDAAPGVVRVADLIDKIPSNSDGLRRLRQRALEHPIYHKTLISSDARTAAIEITFRPMSDSEFVTLGLDERIAALLAGATTPERRFYATGRPHVRSQAHHIMVRDLVTLVPIAVVVAAGVLWWMCGSFAGMLIPLLACLLATLWVYAAMALLGVDINLITLVIGPMMICLGSVYGVHVLARYRLVAAASLESRTAALAALTYVRTPVAIAGATTCIGFGALLLADVPATNQLGGFAIVGIAGVSLLTLTGVPAALALFGPATEPLRSQRRTPSARFGESLDRLLHSVARFVTRRPSEILAFWAIATAAAAVAIPRITIDTDFISFFRSDSEVRRDFDAVNRLLAGAVPIYVPIAGPGEGAFREPEALRAVARLQQRLETLPGVNEVLASVDAIRLANRALHEGDSRYATIPDTRAAVAETLFLLPKDDLRRFATSNHGRSNLIVRSDRFGSEAVRALEADIQAVIARSDWPAGQHASVTGNTILLNRSADEIAGNQATQVGLAALAIFVLVVAAFRSWRLGAIAMVPNIVPVVVFFGILGMGAAPLSIPTSLIGSIALGIAIDDSLHFLVAYQRQRQQGVSPDAAAEACVVAVGRPIVMTSIMIVVGFLVILMSGFATLQEFGALTALTMAICLATDLLLLPALLVRLRA